MSPSQPHGKPTKKPAPFRSFLSGLQSAGITASMQDQTIPGCTDAHLNRPGDYENFGRRYPMNTSVFPHIYHCNAISINYESARKTHFKCSMNMGRRVSCMHTHTKPLHNVFLLLCLDGDSQHLVVAPDAVSTPTTGNLPAASARLRILPLYLEPLWKLFCPCPAEFLVSEAH